MDLAMTKAGATTLPRLERGPSRSFENLYEIYRLHVYRFARSLAGDPAEAEDLFQETWLRAARAFGSTPRAGDIRAWLFTITANLHKDSARRKRVRRLFWIGGGPSRDSRPGPDKEKTSVPDDSARTDFWICLRRAIARLKPEERRIFVLKEIEGLKHREIASILSVPENTVRSRLHRAVKNLQEELKNLGIESPRERRTGYDLP